MTHVRDCRSHPRMSGLAPTCRVPCAPQKLPTFLYAMPFSPTTVFLEETSLVAKPAVPFPELKRRLERRMEHLGIKITKVMVPTFCITIQHYLAGTAVPFSELKRRLKRRMAPFGIRVTKVRVWLFGERRFRILEADGEF